MSTGVDSQSLGAHATSQTRNAARKQVLSAARQGFLEKGVRKTTMEDVARLAGTTRQIVYKLFLGRRELVEAAVAERITELADVIAAHHWETGDVMESFTAASIEVIDSIRDDPELGVLLEAGSPITLHEALWLSGIKDRNQKFWVPWIERVRGEGLLRDDVSTLDLADWLETVYASMILRTTMDSAEKRFQIEHFVLPSLMVPGRQPRESSPKARGSKKRR